MKMWAGVSVVALVLTGCGTGADEAEAAYEACGTDLRPMRLDGDTVHIEVLGADAANLAQNRPEGKPDAGSLSDEQREAFGSAVGVITALDCLVEHTAYPGSTDDLTDGDEWDGWRYSEPDTVGSEIRLAFTATG